MSRKYYFALFAAFAILLAFLGAFYIVPTNEHIVVTQFGKIVRTHSTPGIHAKIPFLDVIYRYPKWLQEHDSKPVDTILGDKRNIRFDTFLLYRISDPATFHTRIRTQKILSERIDDIIYGAIRIVAGLYTYEDILTEKREEILIRTTDRVRAQAQEMGIDVVSSAIRNFTLPDQNLQAIYSNMKSERVRIAQRVLSQGTAQANRITSEADRKAQETIASAVKKSQTLRGEGDKEAQVIISEAMGNAYSLYEQMKAIEFFQKGVKENTVLIVDPKTGLFKYLNSMSGTSGK